MSYQSQEIKEEAFKLFFLFTIAKILHKIENVQKCIFKCIIKNRATEI